MIEVLRLDRVQAADAMGRLRQLDLCVREGEVHGLIGEYGVDHGHMGRLCAGLARPEEGRVYYYNRPLPPLSFLEARRQGIYLLAADGGLQGDMTALENIYLTARRSFGWLYRRERVAREARQYQEFFGVEFPLDGRAGELTALQAVVVGMIGAILAGARLFILDQATSVLNEQDAVAFRRVLSCLKFKGLTVLCMVQRIEELTRYTDRATLVKKGTTVRCVEKDDYSYDKLLAMLLL